MKKFIALLLAMLMVLSVVPFAAAEDEPIIIRWGTHWAAGQDPNLIDETTGTYTMTDESDRQLRLAAEAAVLEKHNVKIVHVQYAQDTRSELVLSVLAGNPCCEIAPYVVRLGEHSPGAEHPAAPGCVRLRVRGR